MAVVKVPKTPKTSFNRDRRPSALLLDQIKHLEWAVLPASQRKPHQLPKARVKTEGQAAERVAQLTKMVLAARAAVQAAAAAGAVPPAPVVLPPLPAAERGPQSPRKRAKPSAQGRVRGVRKASKKGAARARARAPRPAARHATGKRQR